jgi:hypothetical protein
MVYSQIFYDKLYKKTKKDIYEINVTYIKLYNEIINSNLKNTEIYYYNYISFLISRAKENNNIYQIKLLDEKKRDNFDKINEMDKIIPESDILPEDEKVDNNNDNIKENEINNDNLKENLIVNDNKNDSINENETNYNKYKIELKQYQGMKVYTNFDKIEKEISPYVRKFKKQLRNIKRLKIIDSIFISNSLNEGILNKIWNCLKIILILYIFSAILLLELAIPQIDLYNKGPNKRESKESSEDSNESNFLEFLEYLVVIIIFTIINSPYTICLFIIINKKQLISGDLLYSQHTGDNLNLIYTMKAFSGMALPLAYCNLLLYKTVLGKGQEKIPILYNTIKFPEYKFNNGADIIHLIKLILFPLFWLLSIFFDKILFYKFNDLGNFKILK